MLEATERHLEQIRRQLLGIARHVRGAKTLSDALYGVGPITALALTCWLGGAAGSPHRVRRSASLAWT
jgi:hypothetical protein